MIDFVWDVLASGTGIGHGHRARASIGSGSGFWYWLLTLAFDILSKKSSPNGLVVLEFLLSL